MDAGSDSLHIEESMKARLRVADVKKLATYDFYEKENQER